MNRISTYVLLALLSVPTTSFGGWFDFLKGDDKPETPSQQQVSIAQINQWRKEVGLPPVTGNLATDRPMLERECATGIRGSCQLIGQTVPAKTQCLAGLISVGNLCCTPDFSACINPSTGQMLQVPSGGRYGGNNYGTEPRSRELNPNRFECVERCKESCPDPTIGSVTSAITCGQNCVDRCYYYK
jgi:hypothetical protein